MKIFMLQPLEIVFILNALVVVTIIIYERRRPEKTVAWILVFALMPPLGLFLYILMGRNWKIHKLNVGFSSDTKEMMDRFIRKIDDTELIPLFKLLAKNSDSPLFIHNEVKVFHNGKDKFDALKEELEKAQHHIHLEYFIVKSDAIGNEIKDILIRKASEGVKVRFIMDRFGAIKAKRSFIRELKKGGVEVVQYTYFLAHVLRKVNIQINYRNHRKIAIIDNNVGFIGGINIGDEYLGKGKLGFWRDTHLMVKGDFVIGLQAVFLDDFLTLKGEDSQDSPFTFNQCIYYPREPRFRGTVMQLAQSGPDSSYPAIMHCILKMISMAEHHIYITTPYFVPPESIMEALKIAALGGIDVRILFPGRYDHFFVYKASQTYLQELVACGARVYFYDEKAFVHAKVITVDSKISTVGTANMDIRSFRLNYEINAVIYDECIATQLEEQFYRDLEHSQLITQEYYENISRPEKLVQSVARVFSALL